MLIVSYSSATKVFIICLSAVRQLATPPATIACKNTVKSVLFKNVDLTCLMLMKIHALLGTGREHPSVKKYSLSQGLDT